MEKVVLLKSRKYLWEKLAIVESVATPIERNVAIAIEALKDVNRAVNALLDDSDLLFTDAQYKRLQKTLYAEITPLLKRLI